MMKAMMIVGKDSVRIKNELIFSLSVRGNIFIESY